MNPLITPAEADALIRSNLPSIPTIVCPLNKCAGRILREPILADRPFPPFNRSMMDGYAIRSGALAEGQTFKVTRQVPAGSPQQSIDGELHHCAEIMTGAVVPSDADTVVPYEETEKVSEDTIRLTAAETIEKGDCIHPLGSDHTPGAALIEPGRLIGSREIAIAASCGYSSLQVAKIPAIAIVSTGDELVPVDAQPAAHQIRRSNDIAVETALARVQLHAQSQTHLPDDPEVCRQMLEGLMEANTFIIISGGISMGKKDFIPDTLTALGLTGHFHGVAQKPGKPMGYWSGPGCGVFALPGNPISTLTCLHRYVIPAILVACGFAPNQTTQTVQLTEKCRARDHLTVFLPVALSPDQKASPRSGHNSGDMVSILQSDGLIELPPVSSRCYEAGSLHPYINWL